VFDVGFTEILMIGVVALVVIGPERLPAVAKTAGQWVGKLQRFVRGVKTDLASELQSGDLKKLIGDQREQINELKQMVNSAKKDFQNSSRDIVQGAKKSLGDLESSVNKLDGASAVKEGSAPSSANSVKSDSSSHAQKASPVSGVKTVDPHSHEPVNPLPPSSIGDQETPTMRSDSSGSSDDSADMNRTGTESGS
jgi:sec-independent protein translocase protein TatB